jgi:EKC/KEOPS complex subunit CGI121/TPRKB
MSLRRVVLAHSLPSTVYRLPSTVYRLLSTVYRRVPIASCRDSIRIHSLCPALRFAFRLCVVRVPDCPLFFNACGLPVGHRHTRGDNSARSRAREWLDTRQTGEFQYSDQSIIMSLVIDFAQVPAEIDHGTPTVPTSPTDGNGENGENGEGDRARDGQPPSAPQQWPPSTSAPRAKTLSVFLVRNISNAADVRADILAGANVQDAGDSGANIVDAAFIDASLVPTLSVLRSAAAMACQNLPALKTKTVHAELIWSLSGNRHVGRALSTFGVQDTSRHVLVAKFDATEGEMEELRGRVEGELVEGVEAIEAALREVCDVARLKKVYGICDAELEIGSIEEGVVVRIAARDCG